MEEKLIYLVSLRESLGKTGGDIKKGIEKNAEAKKLIAELSRYYFNESPSGCSNCYLDLFVRLSRLINKKTNKMSKFKMRYALLRDPKGNSKYFLTPNNMSDELAIYHLANNPNAKNVFITKDESIDYSKFVGKSVEQIKAMINNLPEEEVKKKEPEILTVAELKKVVAVAENADKIEEIIAQEKSGKNRSSVIKYAEKRLEELK